MLQLVAIRRGDRRRRHRLAIDRLHEPVEGRAGAVVGRGRPDPIVEGQGITIVWQGKPIFVRHRTPQEIKEAEDVPLAQLIEPQPDNARVKPGHDQWIVLVGICTHLGCVPLGNKPSDPRGDGAAGSAPATAASTTPPGACATGRRR